MLGFVFGHGFCQLYALGDYCNDTASPGSEHPGENFPQDLYFTAFVVCSVLTQSMTPINHQNCTCFFKFSPVEIS